MAIKLPAETERLLIGSVKRFLREHEYEGPGDLQAMTMLEFCLKEIGPSIYNQAITDAQLFMQHRVKELDTSCFEPEFGYWRKELVTR